MNWKNVPKGKMKNWWKTSIKIEKLKIVYSHNAISVSFENKNINMMEIETKAKIIFKKIKTVPKTIIATVKNEGLIMRNRKEKHSSLSIQFET